jgi:Fe-coproporphyrin III synthase
MSKINLIRAYLKKPVRIKNFISGYARKILLQTKLNEIIDPDSFPKTLFINLTNTCNAHCKMCQYESSGRLNNNVERLSLDNIKKLIDEVAHFSPNISFVGGGEPLTHPQVAEIVSYTHSKKLFVGLTTNGLLLKEKALDLANAGIDYVTVSLDGPPDIHNKVRGVQNCYEKAIEGIKEIKKHKKIIVQTATTLFDMNYDHVMTLFKNLSTLDVDAKFGALLMNFSNNKQINEHNDKFSSLFYANSIPYDNVDSDKIDFKKIENIIKKSKKDFGVIWEYEPKDEKDLNKYFLEPDQRMHKEPVRCPWLFATITNTGNVVFCIDVVNSDGLVLGNIKETSFKEIWLGEKNQKFRKILKAKGGLPVCNRCCAHLNPWNGI